MRSMARLHDARRDRARIDATAAARAPRGDRAGRCRAAPAHRDRRAPGRAPRRLTPSLNAPCAAAAGVARPGRRVPRVRVLVLTADIGAGHDLPAELLADALRDRAPAPRSTSRTALVAMGPFLARHRAQRRGDDPRALPRAVRAAVLADHRASPRRAGSRRRCSCWSARAALLRLIRRVRPDVDRLHLSRQTEILGALRRAGRSACPCVSRDHRPRRAALLGAPGDRPAPDHPRRVARRGPRDRRPARRRPPRARPVAAGVRGPAGAAAARAALGLPATGRSCSSPAAAGASATWRRRGAPPVAAARPRCACAGRTRPAGAAGRRFAGDAASCALEGFTDRMCELTGGRRRARALDRRADRARGADVRDRRAISYGWGVGHIRAQQPRHTAALRARRGGRHARALLEPSCGARSTRRASPTGPSPPCPGAADAVLELARCPAAPEMRAAARPRDGPRGRAGRCPALAPVVPARRGRAAHPTRCAAPGGRGAHVRRRAAPAGHARGPRRRSPRRARSATFFLVGEQVARDAGARRRDRGRRPRGRRPRRPPPQPPAGRPAGARGRPRRAPRATIADATGTRRSSTARRTASTRRPRCAPSARAGGRRCCGRAGAATGRAARRRRRSRGRSPERSSRATSCSSTTPTTTARPAAGAPRAGALPRVLDAVAAAGLRPVPLAGAADVVQPSGR